MRKKYQRPIIRKISFQVQEEMMSSSGGTVTGSMTNKDDDDFDFGVFSSSGIGKVGSDGTNNY